MRGYPVTENDKGLTELGEIAYTGNVIPPQWFRVLRRNDRPYFLAAWLLADIVYWHRLIEVRDVDENGRPFTVFRKKFKADKLQRHYSIYESELGVNRQTIKNAFHYLEKLGLIDIDIRSIEVLDHTKYYGSVIPNVVFFGLNIKAVIKLTLGEFVPMDDDDYDDSEDEEDVGPSYENDGFSDGMDGMDGDSMDILAPSHADVSEGGFVGMSPNMQSCATNTEITTETTTENTLIRESPQKLSEMPTQQGGEEDKPVKNHTIDDLSTPDHELLDSCFPQRIPISESEWLGDDCEGENRGRSFVKNPTINFDEAMDNPDVLFAEAKRRQEEMMARRAASGQSLSNQDTPHSAEEARSRVEAALSRHYERAAAVPEAVRNADLSFVREELMPLAVMFVSLFGRGPIRTERSKWLADWRDQKAMGLTPSDVERGYHKMTDEKLMVKSPGSITAAAWDIRSKASLRDNRVFLPPAAEIWAGGRRIQ